MKSLVQYVTEKFQTSAFSNKSKSIGENETLKVCEAVFDAFKDSINDPTVCEDCYFDTSIDEKELDDRVNSLYEQLKDILPQQNVCQDNDHTWHIYRGPDKPIVEFLPYKGKIRFMIHDVNAKNFYEKTGIKVK